MGANNFKKLEELQLQGLSADTEKIKSNISANIGAFRFITDVIELYFPRMVDLFIGLTGGQPGYISDKSAKNSKYPDLR